MSGIYIHVPFCKQKCIYCNFHSGASLKTKDEYVKMLLTEIELTSGYINDSVETIYFGGGTPSLLSKNDFEFIFKKLEKHYQLSNCSEITIEANPEDLDLETILSFSELPFNRVSIGCQAFDNVSLDYLKRAHSVIDNQKAIDFIQEYWTKNISVDIIYGIPGLTDKELLSSLTYLSDKQIPHISCYALTVEPSTSLYSSIKQKKNEVPDELQTINQMGVVIDKLQELGYIHYEISNFCLPGYESKHNSNYWKQIPYLGLGPSAHSFNGNSRQWNISNNIKYINALKNNEILFEKENLSELDKYNEYVMTGLRTKNGIDILYIERIFGQGYANAFINSCEKFLKEEEINKIQNKFVLTKKGIVISDYIISELFLID